MCISDEAEKKTTHTHTPNDGNGLNLARQLKRLNHTAVNVCKLVWSTPFNFSIT